MSPVSGPPPSTGPIGPSPLGADFPEDEPAKAPAPATAPRAPASMGVDALRAKMQAQPAPYSFQGWHTGKVQFPPAGQPQNTWTLTGRRPGDKVDQTLRMERAADGTPAVMVGDKTHPPRPITADEWAGLWSAIQDEIAHAQGPMQNDLKRVLDSLDTAPIREG